MKKFVSSLVLCSSLILPTFALAQEEGQSSEEQVQVEMQRPHPHPFRWVCAARDIFGRNYYARSSNRNAAERGAMNYCLRARPVNVCHFQGCQRSY